MIPSQVRIFVCTERQDMRRSFDALALAVRERLALEPESGALFVFASKRGNRLKGACQKLCVTCARPALLEKE
jgi:transposase